LALFRSPVFDHADVTTRQAVELGIMTPWADVEDASIASQSRILLNQMGERFDVMFARAANDETKKMVERSLSDSSTALHTSLRDMAGNVTLNTDVLTAELNDVVTASTAYAVNLFKRIPANYLAKVSDDVLGSIQTGAGLQDLIPAMEKHGVQIKNWAKNTALDQTRKVYNSVNAGRMQAVGVGKFEWIHSGGSNQPRELHKARYPNGLNGGIFSFDDLPVIDERTGERGIPGQAPNCHCVMRPVFSFDDDDDND